MDFMHIWVWTEVICDTSVGQDP